MGRGVRALNRLGEALMTALLVMALLCMTLVFQSAHANDLTTDVAIYTAEAAYQGLALVDMGTTLDIRKHPGFSETNPILGRHPSDGKVIGYFAACGISHAVITHSLVNAGWTKTAAAWEAASIGMELNFVDHNYTIGLKARF